MYNPIEQKILQYQKDGRLAVIANLLYDLVQVGWIAFAGLYVIEVLLPTFVIARLSLVKFAFMLLIGTALLIWLSTLLKNNSQARSISERHPRFYLGSLALMGCGIIALAHYRFPWWSIPIILGSYCIVGWLFRQLIQKNASE